tara:strand:- start:2310 stop:2807 length:498 start_codon:yes stop_codon:yes gene_type:complete
MKLNLKVELSSLMKRWLAIVAVVIVGLSINFLSNPPKLGVSPKGYSVAFGHVYYDGKKIENAKAETFFYSMLDPFGDYGWDENNAFYKGKVIPDAHPTGFSAYHYQLKDQPGKYAPSGYYENKNGVFYHGQKLDGADVKTFYAIEFDQGRSNENFYVEASIKEDD